MPRSPLLRQPRVRLQRSARFQPVQETGTQLTIGGIAQTDYILDQSMTLRLNTLDLTLVNPTTVPALGDLVFLLEPAWQGEVVRVAKNQQPNVTYVTLTASNSNEAVAAQAPYDLSDTPNNATTYGYSDLTIEWSRTEDGDEVRGSFNTYQSGLWPGMTFLLTNAPYGLSGASYGVASATVTWPTATEPVYAIEFGEALVDMSVWVGSRGAAGAIASILPIREDELDDSAVTTLKIAENAVTSTRITDGAVTTPKVAANAITANEIAAGAITAEKLEANLVLANTIKTSSSGARVELDSAGMRAYDSTEDVVVNVPTDGSPVYVNAELEATSLVVTGDATLRSTGNTIASGATLTMDSYQASPTTKPTLTQGWSSLTMPVDATRDIDSTHYNRIGLAYDAAGGAGGATKVFWTLAQQSDGTWRILELLASDRTVNRSVAPSLGSSNNGTPYGIVRHSSWVYILYTAPVTDYMNAWYVKRYLASDLSLVNKYGPLSGIINQTTTIPVHAAGTGYYLNVMPYSSTGVSLGYATVGAPYQQGTDLTAAALQAGLRDKTGDSGLTVTGTDDVGPFTITWSDGLNHQLFYWYSDGSLTPASPGTNGGWRQPTLTSNGSNIFIIDKATGSGAVKWIKYDDTMSAVSYIDTTHNPGTNSYVTSAYAGNADIGSARVFVANSGDQVYSYDTFGAVQSNETFPTNGDAYGLTYGDALGDGARFFSMPLPAGGTAVTIRKHSTWTWTAASSIYWAAYSWYDSAGTTHETLVSPLNSITMGRRKYLTITTAALPGAGGADEPNSMRLYLVPNATQPATTAMKLQSTVTATSTTLSDYASGGAAPAVANGFSSVASAATLKSASSEWQLKGDGTASFTNVDASGNVRLTNTTDASLSSTGHAFQIGATASANVIIDNNEIMARSNGAVSPLDIQAEGGRLRINNSNTPTTSASDGLLFGADVTLFRGGADVLATEDTLRIDSARIRLNGVISPTALAANTNNWNPTGLSTANVIRVSTDATPRTLSGISAGTAGDLLLLTNVNSSTTLTLSHDATSTAANRFYCPGAANFSLTAKKSVWLFYDGTASRWLVIG